MQGFCPLASGSKGNAIYIGTKNAKLLIDMGISFRNLVSRLKEIKIDISEIDAVLISHEHSDHIRGIETLIEKMGIPVFANSETAKALCSNISKKPKFKIFSTGETFEFGDIEIHPFSVQHDTLDPVGFTFHIDGLKLGVCTDLGFATSLVRNHLQGCNYLYIESNHEPSMVHASSRPMLYKQRVLGRQGHLSNDACKKLLDEVKHQGLKHVYLAHLSEECNSEILALQKAREVLPESVCISVAYQHKISQPIFFKEE